VNRTPVEQLRTKIAQSRLNDEKNALSAEQATSYWNRAACIRLGKYRVKRPLWSPRSAIARSRSDGGALLLVGVAMRILALRRSLHISHQGPRNLRCLSQNKESHIPRIHLNDRWSRRALAGRACIHLGLASVFVLYWIARSEESDLERIFGELI